MVYTQQALLYRREEVNEQELEASIKEELLNQMEASLKKGLDMCYRLNDGNRTFAHLGNKHFIQEVLNLYPERFPEQQYPRMLIMTVSPIYKPRRKTSRHEFLKFYHAFCGELPQNRTFVGTLAKVSNKTRIITKMKCQKKDARYLTKELISLFYLSETLIMH